MLAAHPIDTGKVEAKRIPNLLGIGTGGNQAGGRHQPLKRSVLAELDQIGLMRQASSGVHQISCGVGRNIKPRASPLLHRPGTVNPVHEPHIQPIQQHSLLEAKLSYLLFFRQKPLLQLVDRCGEIRVQHAANIPIAYDKKWPVRHQKTRNLAGFSAGSEQPLPGVVIGQLGF